MLKVYGSRISYFTGKLEVYLRYRGIEYQRIPSALHAREILQNTGAMQMPVVKLDDGRWLSDTTPILKFLDSSFPGPRVIPSNPLQRFVSLLIEDYADEWLWRPAMHFRWNYRHDRELLSSIIVDELMGHIWLPRAVKRRIVQRRQRNGFVAGDGVSNITWSHVEMTYRKSLSLLEAIFSRRSFVLGLAPTLADIALMGPMLRHFGQDPTPVEIMRNDAPGVYDWITRVWNANEGNTLEDFEEGIPADLNPLLQEICETHMVQLDLNADAFVQGKTRFNGVIQGQIYTSLPVSRYRLWCLESLQVSYKALADGDRKIIDGILDHAAIHLLSTVKEGESGYDAKGEAPFNRAINVYGHGVPIK